MPDGMNSVKYDIGIVGAGIAGSLAAFRLSKKHPALKIALFDIGRPPGKRRRQLEGFMGCLPVGDGKLYPNDIEELISPLFKEKFLDGRKVRPIGDEILSWIESIQKTKLIKTSKISSSLYKKISKDFAIQELNYYSWKPSQIHEFMKEISDELENSNNISKLFDTIITKIEKNKNEYFVYSNNVQFLCKKIIIATGRSGWRYLGELFQNLQIEYIDNMSTYGIRAEMPLKFLKDFNGSHCRLINSSEEVGIFDWNGTVIPEDHSDNLVISAFRSNEDRWKSEKVSFPILIKNYAGAHRGASEAERISKLVFLLSNDRVNKEKIKTLIKGDSQFSMLPEFDKIKKIIEKINEFIPDLILHGSYYVPMLIPHPPITKLNSDLETEQEGCYLAGEAADIFGIISSMVTGFIVADAVTK